jgi:serine/threonine protein phosphatase PrpC
MAMQYDMKTDPGRVRSHNEDYIYASSSPVGLLPNVFLLADGMGGYKAGEYASCHTVQSVLQDLSEHGTGQPVEVLKGAISHANQLIFQEAANDEKKQGMGTTFIACSIEDGRLLTANVGDSRVYISDEDGIRQVTRDHSYVGELLRSGKIDEEEAKVHPRRHYITRAIGAEEEVKPDFFEEDLRPGSKVLLCSDGLTDMLSDAEIHAILSDGRSVSEECQELIDSANNKGGRDNVSVIVIET